VGVATRSGAPSARLAERSVDSPTVPGGGGRCHARDELEEQVGGIGLERQIAELVDDQQLGLGEEGQALLQSPIGVRLGEGGDQGWRGHEQHRVAFADGLTASRPSAMARCVLPTPGGPKSSNASPWATQAGRQLADLPGVERGLGGEVEALQIAHRWEVGLSGISCVAGRWDCQVQDQLNSTTTAYSRSSYPSTTATMPFSKPSASDFFNSLLSERQLIGAHAFSNRLMKIA